MPINLTVTAKTASGQAVSLPMPMRLKLDRSVDRPADILTLFFPFDTPADNLSRLSLRGDIYFEGLVDETRLMQTSTGNFLRVICRSLAALLTDNHAYPTTLDNPTPDSIIQMYCPFMGFLGFKYDTYTPLTTFTTIHGTSVWKAVEAYCMQAFGCQQRVTNDGYLTAKPYASQTVHTFGSGAHPLYSLERIIDRTAPISAISVRDAEGNYSLAVLNNDAPADIRRQRYVIPASPWVNDRSRLATRMIRQSMRDYKTAELTCDVFSGVELGDKVQLVGDTDQTDWRIGRILFSLDENGTFMRLRLVNGEFLKL